MVLTEHQILGWIASFVWPLARCSGLVLTAPIIGSSYVPGRIRAMVVLALAAVIALSVDQVPPLPADPVHVMFLVGRNIVLGAMIGFAAWLAVSTISVAGEMIGLSMALGFARLSSPATGISTPIMSQILLWAGLMAYLAAGGPGLLIAAIRESMVHNPEAHILMGSWHAFALQGALLFKEGLWLALPVLVTAIAVNAVLGIITAMAPSLNVFSIGFPLLYLTGMWLLLSITGDIQTVFDAAFDHALDLISPLAAGPNTAGAPDG